MDVIGALDIGGTKIAVGLVSPTGELLGSETFSTQAYPEPAVGINRIITGLDRLLAERRDRLAGIGIGCTGQIDPVTYWLGYDDSFLPGWKGPVLVAALRQHFQVTVEMQNDAVAAALAEAAWGAGQGAGTMIYVTVSTGIGGAVIHRGQIFTGVGGAHPEIGHHVIDPSGPACFCGAHGCWESLASGSAMAAWYRGQKALNPSGNSLPANEAITAQDICEAARKGDALALSAVRREGYYLGIGLANLVTLFAPDAIVLGGGVMKSLPLFLEPIEKTIRQNAGLVPHEKVRLLPASLGQNTGLIGAAQVWLNKHTE